MHEAVGTYETDTQHELLIRNPSRHLLERALPYELVLAHRRTVFHPWTCGYRRGATAVAIVLEDDPRLRKERDWLLEETIGAEDVGRERGTRRADDHRLCQSLPASQQAGSSRYRVVPALSRAAAEDGARAHGFLARRWSPKGI